MKVCSAGMRKLKLPLLAT